MIKLTTLLREIGENTSTPYPVTRMDGDDELAMFAFKTDSGTAYQIAITKEPGFNDAGEEALIYQIAFGVVDAADYKTMGADTDYNAEVNDPKNMYRVMATVIDTLKKEIAIDEEYFHPVHAIWMTPSKRQVDDPNGEEGETIDDWTDNRRKNFYMAYIKKNMPGARVQEKGNHIWVYLPQKK